MFVPSTEEECAAVVADAGDRSNHRNQSKLDEVAPRGAEPELELELELLGSGSLLVVDSRPAVEGSRLVVEGGNHLAAVEHNHPAEVVGSTLLAAAVGSHTAAAAAAAAVVGRGSVEGSRPVVEGTRGLEGGSHTAAVGDNCPVEESHLGEVGRLLHQQHHLRQHPSPAAAAAAAAAGGSRQAG